MRQPQCVLALVLALTVWSAVWAQRAAAYSNSQVRLPHDLYLADVIGNAFDDFESPFNGAGGGAGATPAHSPAVARAQQWLKVDGDQLFVARTTFHSDGYFFGRFGEHVNGAFRSGGNVSRVLAGRFAAPTRSPDNTDSGNGNGNGNGARTTAIDGEQICVTHSRRLGGSSGGDSEDGIRDEDDDRIPRWLSCYELRRNDSAAPSLVAAGIRVFVLRRLWSQPNFLLVTGDAANGDAAVETDAMAGPFVRSPIPSDGKAVEQLLRYDPTTGNTAFWGFDAKRNRFVVISSAQMQLTVPAGRQLRVGELSRRSARIGVSDVLVFDPLSGELEVWLNPQSQADPSPEFSRAHAMTLRLFPAPRLSLLRLIGLNHSNATELVHSVVVNSAGAGGDRKILRWSDDQRQLVSAAEDTDTAQWSTATTELQLFAIRIKRPGTAQVVGDDILQWNAKAQLFSVVAAATERSRASTSDARVYRWAYTQHPLLLDADPDRDGLLTRHELGGLDVAPADGVSDEPLHLYGASPFVRDVFVEVDHMDMPRELLLRRIRPPSAAGATPAAAAMDEEGRVSEERLAALAKAATTRPSAVDPDTADANGRHSNDVTSFAMLEEAQALAVREFAKAGINLHIMSSDVIPFIVMIGPQQRKLVFDWETYFDPLRYAWMTPSRFGLYHYAVFGNRHNGRASQVSGRSRGIPGHDFVVTLGGWASGTGTVSEQAGTFLHELGHNLGLRHGGVDNVGGKPNHISIMNHIFQVVGIWKDGQSQWLYSELECDALDEQHLNERDGVRCGQRSADHDSRLTPDSAGANSGRGDGLRAGVGSLEEVLTDEVTAAMATAQGLHGGSEERTLLEFTIWTPLNTSADFNRDGILTRDVKYDLNHDGNLTVLAGSPNEYHILDLPGGLGPVGAPPNITHLTRTPHVPIAPYSPYSHRSAAVMQRDRLLAARAAAANAAAAARGARGVLPAVPSPVGHGGMALDDFVPPDSIIPPPGMLAAPPPLKPAADEEFAAAPPAAAGAGAAAAPMSATFAALKRAATAAAKATGRLNSTANAHGVNAAPSAPRPPHRRESERESVRWILRPPATDRGVPPTDQREEDDDTTDGDDSTDEDDLSYARYRQYMRTLRLRNSQTQMRAGK